MMAERFGDYVVTGALGQGAMGVVMRVRHATFDVDRALKVLSQVTPERLARFEREGRTLAEIRHPNVVTVHETGVRDGRPWFVMDLVEGQALDGLLHTAGRLPVAQVLSLGAGLARGLAALHGNGVVHRDLKPSNVLVRTDGTPVIVDLGVALAPESEDDRLTRTGALVGTLSYMAPEQLTGERATAASDVYALGAILFEAACGTPAAPDARSLQEFVSRVVGGATPRVGNVDPELPAALDRLLVRAMAKGASARPSALDLAAALEAPGVATSGPARAHRRTWRGVGWVAIAALATTGALSALAALAARSRPTEPVEPPAPSLAEEAAPVVSAAPTVDLAAVTRELERASGHREPLVRRAALAHWLKGNPDDPRAAQALEAWRATLREAPLAVWTLAPGKRAHGILLADGRALGWVHSEPGVWLADPWAGVATVLGAKKLQLVAVEHDPRGGQLLVDSRGQLHRLAPGATDLVLERARTPNDATIRSLAVTDERLVFSWARVVKVVDRATQVVTSLQPFENAREVAIADEGRVVAVATGATTAGGPIWLFCVEVASGKRLVSQIMGARVSVLAAAPNGQVLAALTSGVILLLDARTGDERGRFVSADIERGGLGVDQNTLAHDVAPRAAVFVDGGRRLVSVGGNIGGARGDLRCWDVATGHELAPPIRFPAACLRVDVARDERTILVSLDSGSLQLWAAPDRPAELDVDLSSPR